MSKNPRKAPDARASSKASPEVKAAPDATPKAAPDQGSGHEAILLAIAELRTELLTKAEVQSAEIRSQVDQLRAEIKLANDNANAKSEALDKRVVALESAASSHSDLIANLERDMANVRRELTTLRARNEDLEARSRRNNLRITGIKERREDGKRTTDFISQYLKESLGLDKPPLLDRAHRTLRVRPGVNDPPRAFIIRCHYYQEKEEILRKAGQMKQLTTGDGDKIRIQPDYTQAVAKQRAEFNEVRGLLRSCEGIRYGLWYPAELRITTPDGVRTSFKDPKQAKDFIMKNLNGAAGGGNGTE